MAGEREGLGCVWSHFGDDVPMGRFSFLGGKCEWAMRLLTTLWLPIPHRVLSDPHLSVAHPILSVCSQILTGFYMDSVHFQVLEVWEEVWGRPVHFQGGGLSISSVFDHV